MDVSSLVVPGAQTTGIKFSQVKVRSTTSASAPPLPCSVRRVSSRGGM
jgi:hypothetical protein